MKKVIPGAVLTLYLLATMLQVVRIVAAVRDTRQLDYGEGIILWQASQVFNLKSAFHPLQQYPYIVFHYTPIYHMALRAVAAVVGDPLLSGRLISMAAAFWLAGLFVWIVLRATRGYATNGVRWFSAVFAGSWVLLLPAMQWVPFARVDMLGLAMQFTALSIICARPLRFRNQIAAFFLLLLGLYTKQSLLAIPAASILLIALIRPVRAIWLACGLAATGLAVLLILARVTNGGVIRHWILYNVNPFHLKDALFAEQAISKNLAALLAIGLAAFWLTLPGFTRGHNWRRNVSVRLATSRLRITGVGFGLAATLGFLISWGIGKEGANINYCLDWELALCPLAGIFIVLFSHQLRGQKRDRGVAFLRPVLFVLLAATGLQLCVQAFRDADTELGWTGATREKLQQERRDNAEVIRIISTFPGPVVSDDLTALQRAGKSIPFEPAIIKQTTDTHIFDQNELVERITGGFFDAFVLTDPGNAWLRFTPRVLEAMRNNYQVYPVPGGRSYEVYVRRQP